MFIITQKIYQNIAERLIDAINGLNYYSGIIEFETDHADIKFTSSLMIYYKTTTYPSGEEIAIHDVIPIFWELSAVTLDGEQLNDFDFSTLKHFMTIC